MAEAPESQYKDLLTPLKDSDKAFAIDISELLLKFLTELMENGDVPNFNSAALLIQGSASVYSKKVELLYNQASKLHDSLLKQQKNDKDQQQQEKKDSHKERAKKEDKLEDDPFLEPEIKMGKNLSCLTKKNASKNASKKITKKIKSFSAPVHLLMQDNDDKGEAFYDTRGDLVGNKGDFALNQCVLTDSGWLLLPTVNPNLIPPPEAVSDYDDNSDNSPFETESLETGDLEPIQSTPDEGFGSCPSSDLQQCTPEVDSLGNKTANSDQIIPMSNDEGIGETPGDAPDFADSPGAENIPISDGEESPVTVPQPVRQKHRQALRGCQLSMEDSPLQFINLTKDLCKKKAIEKKNVRCLPKRLRNDGSEIIDEEEESISAYCARIFFSVDDKSLRGSSLNFQIESFSQNTSFVKKLTRILKVLKSSDKKFEYVAPIENSSKVVDIEGVEVSRDANEDDHTLNIPFDDNDVNIEHDPAAMIEHPSMNFPAGDNADDVDLPELDSPDVSEDIREENLNHIRNLEACAPDSGITERVQEWEASLKPFLAELEKRGSFDINECGSKILDSFEDSDRKQTKTFRELCRNMEKWEIHRNFMAILPLANNNNVELDKEKKDDGTEEIFVTLKNRKMHHKELEEFGHNDGEHS